MVDAVDFVGGICIVVASCFIQATFYFEFVAYAVAICIVQAVAVTIVPFFREDASFEIRYNRRIDVVARIRVDATGHLVFVADVVAISVVQAVAVAVIVFLCIVAATVLICSVSIVIARCFVLAARHFKLVADAVAVHVAQAVTIAIVACLSELT